MAGEHTDTAAPVERTASPWLDVKGCAGRAHVGTRTIYNAIADGRLKAAKLSGRGCFRVHVDWLDSYIEAQAAPIMVPARRRA